MTVGNATGICLLGILFFHNVSLWILATDLALDTPGNLV